MIVAREAERPPASGVVARDLVLDLAGPALLVASAGWALIAADRWDAPARSMVALFVAAGAALVAGRLLGGLVAQPTVPWVVALISIPVAWVSWTDLLADGRMNEPFGYPNAQGAFFVLSVVAAAMAAVTSRGRVLRIAGLMIVSALSVVVLLSGSVAASLLLVLPVGALVARRFASSRAITVTMAALAMLVLVGTVALGAGFTSSEPRGEGGPLESALTGRRLALWHDALVMIREQPVDGVGPGRFRFESPTARSDQDAVWTHNDFLQQGAETGLVGMGLLLGAFAWAFWRLAARRGRDAAVVLASAGLGALAIHASLDYILRFPALPLTAAVLLGWAIAPPKEITEARGRVT